MKRMFLAITLFVGVFALTACGLGDDDTLRVGMDTSYPPFETTLDGEPEGISVEIANELGDFLGRDVEIVDTDFGALIQSLNVGEVDVIIGSMSITEERAESVDFSDPYQQFNIIGLVNQEYGDEHGLDSDSSSEDVLAIEETRFTGIADQVSGDLPEEFGFEVILEQDQGNAVANVAQGQADVLMMSGMPVARGHVANPDSTFILYDDFEPSPIGMAVRQGEDELLSDINDFISQMEEQGVNDRLSDLWENADEWIDDEDLVEAMSEFDMEYFLP